MPTHARSVSLRRRTNYRFFRRSNFFDHTGVGAESGPTQVALPSPQVAARFEEIQERTHAFRRGDVDHVVHCFARLEGADEFQSQFGGEMMRPQDRPK